MKDLKLFDCIFRVLAVLFILSSTASLYAQSQESDSLIFSIDNDPVYKSEFLKQYHKNNSTNIQNDTLSIKAYAELYLRYKLKVKAAKDEGLDTLTSFLAEYNRYRKQLADKYISNGKVTQEMVEDIYHRMVTEVNASHILLSLNKDATPADTLETYNTAIDLLKKIENGESFEELAMKYSKDPSVRINKGNLGWFKAFKMAYPFESSAYNLDINEVSQPVRTSFGYHLIKKNDERPSKGKVKVAHIMKRHKPNDSTYNAEEEIYKIYQKLKSGENFEDLAKQFSDHTSTAPQGGELPPFGVGDMNSKRFEELAFNIDEVNTISEPFSTQFGWHVLKYNGNIPEKPLSEIETELVKKIKTSDRSKRLISNIKKDLMQRYQVNTNYEKLSSIENLIDDNILKSKWFYDENSIEDADWILKIDDFEYKVNEFLIYIQRQQRNLTGTTVNDKINDAIDKFTYAKLIEVHNKNLENISPEFASEIKTYFDGLLLFEIMERKIWSPVQNDIMALRNYYELNREKFISPISIDGYVFSSNNKKTIKEIKDDIGKDSVPTLIQKYPSSIFKKLDKTDIKSSFIPYELMLETNKPKIYKHNGQYLCILITQIYPSKVLAYENVKGRVIERFQKEKEEEWIFQLKDKYDIFINENLIQNLDQTFEK